MSGERTETSSPLVSVIVPTYGREEVLCDTIKDLLAQDYEPYEIIVVDQTPNHAPETVAFLESLPSRVRRIEAEEPNLPAARNVGIRHARGEIVIFVDDDVRLESGFVSAHAGNYKDHDIAAVAGPVLSHQKRWQEELPPYAGDEILGTFCACWQYDKRIEVRHAPGGNMSFRRKVAEDAGYFDESYTGPGFREESDFFMRVSALGVKIVYDPECWLIHAGFRPGGGCWEAYDGLPPVERFFNHAYFILKNFPRKQWARLFLHSVSSSLIRREVCRHPVRGARKACRFARGWVRAWRSRPSSRLSGGTS